MAETKTKPTGADVAAFLDKVADQKRREDGKALCALLRDVTGEPPVLWGPSIVGFGRYHYVYASGHEGDAPIAGFSPRAKELVVYLHCQGDWSEALHARLGKHRAGKSCLYIKSLADVDQSVLAELIERSADEVRKLYPAQA